MVRLEQRNQADSTPLTDLLSRLLVLLLFNLGGLSVAKVRQGPQEGRAPVHLQSGQTVQAKTAGALNPAGRRKVRVSSNQVGRGLVNLNATPKNLLESLPIDVLERLFRNPADALELARPDGAERPRCVDPRQYVKARS